MGEHNRYVLEDLAGLDTGYVDSLDSGGGDRDSAPGRHPRSLRVGLLPSPLHSLAEPPRMTAP